MFNTFIVIIVFRRPNHIDPSILHYYYSFRTLEAEFLKNNPTFNNKDPSTELFKASTACFYAAKTGLTIAASADSNNSTRLPVVLIKPVLCGSTGNNVGFMFELMSFAIEHKVAIARVSGHSDSEDPFAAARCNQSIVMVVSIY